MVGDIAVPKMNYTMFFQKIALLRKQNLAFTNALKQAKSDGIVLRRDEIAEYKASIRHNKMVIDDLREKIVTEMQRMPAFRNDKRFQKIPREEREKMQRFFESAYEQKKTRRPLFEDHCKATVDSYDGTMELFGEAFPESFTDAQKLSSLFVNKGLTRVWDIKTQTRVDVSYDTLKLCSYPQKDINNFDVNESIQTMGEGDLTALESFYKTISLRPHLMNITTDFVDNKVARNPEGATAMLTKSEVDEVTKRVMDLGIISEDVEGQVFEEVAICSTARATTLQKQAIDGQELRAMFDLPPVQASLTKIEADGETFWVSDDAVLTNAELDENYTDDIARDTEVEALYKSVWI